MSLEIRQLDRAEITDRLDDIAGLRITVFRAFPYLYEGDRAYEAEYLRAYTESPRSLVVGCFAGDRLVGAATGAPMEDHAEEFAGALAAAGIDPHETWYCGESVLLPECRGQGVYRQFFERREAAGRALGRRQSVFCAVIRPADHPMRPANYQPLDPIWQRYGYRRIEGAEARFPWRDLGDAEESEKPMSLWLKPLG
ncbi:MAG: GNAT family N-acetyltransferase [Pseudomonadota bacterium]